MKAPLELLLRLREDRRMLPGLVSVRVQPVEKTLGKSR
jgi:hypothetical protein